ncbi:peptidylprolyl isomerase [Streptomyces sp. NPDC021080]|uniref:peptidylprolyl isomerase n=1 Tax=Streptomyces sp. NPDC021080 TaxID=3365110 RepID=UPI0037BB80A7
MSDQKQHVLLDTRLGEIELELDAEKAPITVKNFLEYVDEGFYDGTYFHYVHAGVTIWGGLIDNTMHMKSTVGHDKISNEAGNGLLNTRGTVAVARMSFDDPDSVTSQFLINVADNDFLDPRGDDPGHAVFGKVTKGMDVVDQIANGPTISKREFSAFPANEAYIGSVKRID